MIDNCFLHNFFIYEHPFRETAGFLSAVFRVNLDLTLDKLPEIWYD